MTTLELGSGKLTEVEGVGGLGGLCLYDIVEQFFFQDFTFTF